MDNHNTTPPPGPRPEFTPATTQRVLELTRRFETLLPNDPDGQERAFSNAVRAAWVAGEAWAVEWVEKATGGRMSGRGDGS